VDDDEDVREAVSSALDDEGYEVVVARDGVDALSALRRLPPPGLIVLDLTMPRMNGSEFRRRVLAELPQLAAIPVVIMSADVEGRVQARTLGAAAFLRKPIRLTELFRTVGAQLGARNVEPGA
jgi:CheY-like chemotaxis protein